jgi:transcriptional regulator with XRE-family HTH domain
MDQSLPLDAFLTQKGWSNAQLAREMRLQRPAEADDAYQRAILNLAKNIAKWRSGISRPTPPSIAALEQLSGGALTYKSFYPPP